MELYYLITMLGLIRTQQVFTEICIYSERLYLLRLVVLPSDRVEDSILSPSSSSRLPSSFLFS